jgi:hypothetical protein
MRDLFPWFSGLVLFLLGLGAAAYLCMADEPDSKSAPGVGGPEPALEREQQRAQHLQTELNKVQARRHERARILTAAATGRVKLLEAAAQLRAVDLRTLDEAYYDYMLALVHTGCSTGERMCRKVIQDVRELEDAPFAPTAAADRLEKELAMYLKCHGSVILPGARHE